MELNLTIADLPAELVTAVADDAARDADYVGYFLRDVGIQGTPEKKVFLPSGFLLHLGAALRLHSWESQGFFFHRAEGLPEAKNAILSSFELLNDPSADPSQFCLAVLHLYVRHFAWHGRRDLDADVALGDLIDDAALDAVAEHLWASRHVGNATGSPKP